MLLRETAKGIVAVAQPMHAWISGKLAAAWGNVEFGEVAPREEVLLAAAQHDIGWVAWECAPQFNPRTGFPHTFLELPTAGHLEIWRSTGPALLAFGRYPALLASRHGTGLYERLHDYARDSEEEVRGVREFLAEQKAFQDRLIGSLRGDPQYAAHVTPEVLLRNQRLMALWDALSLALCFGRAQSQTFRDVPRADGTVTLALSPIGGDPERWILDPWPFQAERVQVGGEGRWLGGPCRDEGEMQKALEVAGWVRFTVQLQGRGVGSGGPRQQGGRPG